MTPTRGRVDRRTNRWRRGVLVNVSSIVGAIAQPYTSAYGITKFGIRGLSASLREELWLDGARGVHVCAVLPATIDTPLFHHAGNYTGRKAVEWSASRRT